MWTAIVLIYKLLILCRFPAQQSIVDIKIWTNVRQQSDVNFYFLQKIHFSALNTSNWGFKKLFKKAADFFHCDNVWKNENNRFHWAWVFSCPHVYSKSPSRHECLHKSALNKPGINLSKYYLTLVPPPF